MFQLAVTIEGYARIVADWLFIMVVFQWAYEEVKKALRERKAKSYNKLKRQVQ